MIPSKPFEPNQGNQAIVHPDRGKLLDKTERRRKFLAAASHQSLAPQGRTRYSQSNPPSPVAEHG
jgi:hypothetical protein